MFLSGSSRPGMVWLPEHVRHSSLTLLQPGPELFKEHIMSLCNHMTLEKAQGRGEGEGSCFYFGKSKLPKAFVSHCMEFLAVFHSQCLSSGTRLEAEQEKQSTTSGTAPCHWAVLWPRQGRGRNPEDATVPTEKGQWHKHGRQTLELPKILEVLWHILPLLKSNTQLLLL